MKTETNLLQKKQGLTFKEVNNFVIVFFIVEIISFCIFYFLNLNTQLDQLQNAINGLFLPLLFGFFFFFFYISKNIK